MRKLKTIASICGALALTVPVLSAGNIVFADEQNESVLTQAGEDKLKKADTSVVDAKSEEAKSAILEEAKKNAKAKAREVMLEAKEENHKLRAALDQEMKDRRREIEITSH